MKQAMVHRVERPSGEIGLVFSTPLRVAGAAQLYRTLDRALDEAKALAIDLAQVEHVDAAGIQVLFAFRAEAAARGIALRWTAISPQVESACQLLRLSLTK